MSEAETGKREIKIVAPKRLFGRNVVFGLALACLLLIAFLGTAIAYYTIRVNEKDSQIDSLNAQLASVAGWLNDNITAYNNFVANHTYTNAEFQNLSMQLASLQGQLNDSNSEITSLQSEIAGLQAPNLIKVNLKSDDNRPSLGTSYLHVYGEVCNVGFDAAYNSKLHVVANQSDDVVAVDTYIVLGTISGQSWVSVDSSLTYSGSSLTTWAVTLQWTASP